MGPALRSLERSRRRLVAGACHRPVVFGLINGSIIRFDDRYLREALAALEKLAAKLTLLFCEP